MVACGGVRGALASQFPIPKACAPSDR